MNADTNAQYLHNMQYLDADQRRIAELEDCIKDMYAAANAEFAATIKDESEAWRGALRVRDAVMRAYVRGPVL